MRLDQLFEFPVIGSLCHAQANIMGIGGWQRKYVSGEGFFLITKKARHVNNFFDVVGILRC